MKPQIFTIALALAVGATGAVAETVCMPAGEMKASLIDWYGEKPVAPVGENREQLWASEKSGTWTMVKLMANGKACVLAQGDDWLADVKRPALMAALRD